MLKKFINNNVMESFKSDQGAGLIVPKTPKSLDVIL